MDMLEVNIKRIEPTLIASIREQNRPMNEFANNFNIISDDVKAHGIKESGPWLNIYHGQTSGIWGVGKTEQDDWEACTQIENEYVTHNPKIKVYQLPAVEKAACLIYKGPWGRPMKSAFDSFLKWCELNGIKWSFPYRTIYHVGEREYPDAVCPLIRDAVEGDVTNNFITEIQFPLK
jgi:effector-binding domain-containing protein